MRITFLTLFPELFPTILNTSMLWKAQKENLVEYKVVSLRDFGIGTHKSVDDRPFGGGAGMIFRADVLKESVSRIQDSGEKPYVILTTPTGVKFDQKTALELSKKDNILIISGHYEGVDQRFIDKYVDLEISIGDYVLTGGELPSMIIADAVTRLIPGVLKKEGATEDESFTDNLLEYPHYTRPEEFEGEKVPEILRSGDHQKIKDWKREKSIEKTKLKRPDLLNG